jgi:hypothetical protein
MLAESKFYDPVKMRFNLFGNGNLVIVTMKFCEGWPGSLSDKSLNEISKNDLWLLDMKIAKDGSIGTKEIGKENQYIRPMPPEALGYVLKEACENIESISYSREEKDGHWPFLFQYLNLKLADGREIVINYDVQSIENGDNYILFSGDMDVSKDMCDQIALFINHKESEVVNYRKSLKEKLLKITKMGLTYKILDKMGLM